MRNNYPIVNVQSITRCCDLISNLGSLVGNSPRFVGLLSLLHHSLVCVKRRTTSNRTPKRLSGLDFQQTDEASKFHLNDT